MKFIHSKALTHNSNVSDTEPKWSDVDKTELPRVAFADKGDPDKRSTWKYPHHWISGDNLYLHKGGVNAAWAAANGARSGQMASDDIISHLKKHRKILGLEDKTEFSVEIKKSIVEHQIVYGEVYAPYKIDTDWETITEEDVQQMAWDFLASRDPDSIDINHSLEKSGCKIVESFIARSGDPDFSEGAWVLGVRCTDEVWKNVKSGELNGFSFYGTSKKYPARVLIEVAKQIAGMTEESTVDFIPKHEHTFIVNLNKDSRIISGKTDTVESHFHNIIMSTATEPELGHSHRIFLE